MLKFTFTQYKPVNVVVRVGTPVDEFHFDKCVPAHVGSEAVLVSNPLYVLFNEQRLKSLGDMPLQEWIDAMNQIKSDPLNELRKKVSDEQLIELMKSRYCQQPCELAQWSAYLESRMDELTQEAQQLAEVQQLAEAQKDVQKDVNVVNKQTNSE